MEENINQADYIQKKIELFEQNGTFDVDPGTDPDTIPLKVEDVDYLGKKLSSKISTKIANTVARRFINKLIKSKKMIIKDIIGIENINSIDTGFFMTCNHFNPFDNFAMQKVFEKSKHYKKKTFYKVIREGNYTNFPGLYGYFFRHCNTLPLGSSTSVMKEFNRSVDTLIKNGNIVLLYPEQSLWLNYQKPKPLKVGVFKLATRNNVPIVPCFITFEDSDVIIDGECIKEYTIHISEPIYPETDLTRNENCNIMMEKHFEVWKNIYEKTYNKELTYNTDPKILAEKNIKVKSSLEMSS